VDNHEKEFRVIAALHEETDKGWVWFRDTTGLASRRTIKLSRQDKRRSIYCEFRNLDSNFVKQYDRSEGTSCMYFEGKEDASRKGVSVDPNSPKLRDVLIVGDWYRKALGWFEPGSEQKLDVAAPRCQWWLISVRVASILNQGFAWPRVLPSWERGWVSSRFSSRLRGWSLSRAG
jgi:hypothetical protein